jgi:hypothetical protein
MALLYVVRCGQCSLHCLDDVVECFIAWVIDNYTLAHVAIDKLFLKLGTANGCQGFRKTKMRNCWRALLAVQNLCVRITLRVTTFDTNYSVTDSTQTIAASIKYLLDSVDSPQTESMCQAKRSGYRSVWGYPLIFTRNVQERYKNACV